MTEENTQQKEQEKTYSAVEVDELVNGLKNKVNELLGKNKDAKAAAIEAKTQVEQAKEDGLKKAGDLDALKAHWEDKFNTQETEYKTQLGDAKTAIKQRDQLDIINGLVGEFVDPEAGSYILKGMVDVEDGNQTYKDFKGDVVATNANDFKKWMNTNPSMAHLVQGTKATGGGASGGTSKAGDGKTMSRTDFQQLSQVQRSEFSLKGGTLTND